MEFEYGGEAYSFEFREDGPFGDGRYWCHVDGVTYSVADMGGRWFAQRERAVAYDSVSEGIGWFDSFEDAVSACIAKMDEPLDVYSPPSW